jgi:hypothetical protein
MTKKLSDTLLFAGFGFKPVIDYWLDLMVVTMPVGEIEFIWLASYT